MIYALRKIENHAANCRAPPQRSWRCASITRAKVSPTFFHPPFGGFAGRGAGQVCRGHDPGRLALPTGTADGPDDPGQPTIVDAVRANPAAAAIRSLERCRPARRGVARTMGQARGPVGWPVASRRAPMTFARSFVAARLASLLAQWAIGKIEKIADRPVDVALAIEPAARNHGDQLRWIRHRMRWIVLEDQKIGRCLRSMRPSPGTPRRCPAAWVAASRLRGALIPASTNRRNSSIRLTPGAVNGCPTSVPEKAAHRARTTCASALLLGDLRAHAPQDTASTPVRSARQARDSRRFRGKAAASASLRRCAALGDSSQGQQAFDRDDGRRVGYAGLHGRIGEEVQPIIVDGVPVAGAVDQGRAIERLRLRTSKKCCTSATRASS